MRSAQTILKTLGFSNKEILVYLALLSLGPSSIRKIAVKANVNRGTTYEVLKHFQELGLISYYHHGKRQHFVAEDPYVLKKVVARKKGEIEEVGQDLELLIPSLLRESAALAHRPVVKFYEDYSGIRTILEDTLDSVEVSAGKEYVAFSSSSIRPYLYNKKAFHDFTSERIRRGIKVRTIASGAGGKLQGKDERKWLSKGESAPTYKLVYAGKVAMISVSKDDVPHGLIIEDQGLFETERAIFDSLWKSIK